MAFETKLSIEPLLRAPSSFDSPPVPIEDGSRGVTEEIGAELLVTGTSSGKLRFREYNIAVVEGPDAGVAISAHRGSVVVGSASDADLVLTDPTVSRAHARLVPRLDGVEVSDLGSKNGTFLHGAKVTRCKVKPGTEVTVGRTVLRITTREHERPLPISTRSRFEHLYGTSRPMRELFAQLEALRRLRTPVLIEGERGTGKRRVAEALSRSTGVQPAFRAANEVADRLELQSLFEQPGTLVLLRIDGLRPELQEKLADMIGASTEEAPRLFTTLRGDLESATRSGKVVRALSLELSGSRVRVPSLRERTEDLPVLVRELLEELGQPDIPLSPEDQGRLTAYDWPDNVRELRVSLEKVVSFRIDAPEERTPSSIEESESTTDDLDPSASQLPYKEARSRMLNAFEREYVKGLLTRHAGNVSKASRAAGIDRVYLHRLIKKFGLE